MDNARRETDRKLLTMERKLTKTYNNARKELTEEWQAFMKKQEPRVKEAYEDLQQALRTGDTQTIFDARVYYQRVMMNTTIRNNRYRGMVNDLTEKVAHVNKTALDYINNNMPDIYTINYNAFSTESIEGYSFSIVNENAVKELMATDKMLVPTKHLDIAKDKAWNAKFINSQVTQGIMRGESIDKIANRILPEINAKTDFTDKTKKEVSDLIKRNKNAAIRNARTMVTAAENKGRQDSYNKATSDGVLMDKEWMATGDGRTRDWHVELDGVVVGVDESWVNTYGEIEYPGDPGADPANVYNCRCSMRAHVRGFAWNNKDMVDSKMEETDILSGYKEDMLNADKKDKLNYIFESDPDLAFSLGRDASEEEVNKVLSDLLESNNQKISIMGKEYAHIEKNAVKYLNNTMNVTEEEKSSFSNYVKNIDSFTINNKLRENGLNNLPDYLQKTVRDMDNAISRNILSEPITVTRFADEKYLANVLDMNLQDVYSLVNKADDLSDTLESLKGLSITEKSYLSASTDVDANVFGNFTVKMDLLADSGTPAYFTNNIDESEVIFGRDSKYIIEDIKIKKDEHFSRNRIDLVVKLQNE